MLVWKSRILPIPSPRGKDFSLSNPGRREMATLPLYTNGGNLFLLLSFVYGMKSATHKRIFTSITRAGLGVRDWQCAWLYWTGCINKQLFSQTQGSILQQYPCIWNTKTVHVEKHSRLFTGFDRAPCPHWVWSFFFIFASLMGENCLLIVFFFFLT